MRTTHYILRRSLHRVAVAFLSISLALLATDAFAAKKQKQNAKRGDDIPGINAAHLNETRAPGSSKFHAQELEATRQPIRPGVPGKAPFWNGFTKRFMYAPAFDFAKVGGAVKYKFTATDENGKTHTFTADAPWAPLSPVWNDIAVGAVSLKVEGVDSAGKTVGLAGEREFYRSAIFNGPYRTPESASVKPADGGRPDPRLGPGPGAGRKLSAGETPAPPYTEAGLAGLRGLLKSTRFQHWLKEGRPYPGDARGCYPSKEMGASVRGMVLLSKLTKDKKESEEALKIARIIADYIIDNLTVPAGNKMEYMPYVYWLDPNATVNLPGAAKNRTGETMLSEPPKAIRGYLDLYEACGDKKYLDAAVRAMRTFVKIRRKDGTWPVMVTRDDGKEIESKALVPTWIMFTFNELAKKHGQTEFAKYAADCEKWIMENPAKTFAWDAQFEDIKIRPKYQNMSYDQAADTAWYLLENFPADREKVALAEEILRFIEDQFAVWEKPKDSWPNKFRMPGHAEARHINQWIVPSIIEQHTFYPVCRATVTTMRAFGKAYEVTGREIHRAKAESLANTILVTQKFHGGGEIPTFPMTSLLPVWTNNSVYNAMFLIDLDADLGRRKKRKYV